MEVKSTMGMDILLSLGVAALPFGVLFPAAVSFRGLYHDTNVSQEAMSAVCTGILSSESSFTHCPLSLG